MILLVNQILENLKVFVEAANQRNEALDHTLFHGPPGFGQDYFG
jgi:Holliday junction DNA helicase RuvB